MRRGNSNPMDRRYLGQWKLPESMHPNSILLGQELHSERWWQEPSSGDPMGDKACQPHPAHKLGYAVEQETPLRGRLLAATTHCPQACLLQCFYRADINVVCSRDDPMGSRKFYQRRWQS